MKEQATSHLFMVRPVNFNFNVETAVTNSFQSDITVDNKTVNASAQQSFDNLVELLRSNDIEVTVFDDTPDPYTPDSIFPNNWISTHESGKLVLYPMEAPNRRLERRQDIVDQLKDRFGYDSQHSFASFEEEGKYLEGTGSIVLDRTHNLAYACVSTRTHPDVLEAWSKETGYELVTFYAYAKENVPVYHTNVLMCVGDKFVVICLDAITDDSERKMVVDKIESTGKEVVDITMDQMNAFAGNMLMVKNRAGKNYLVMSERAYLSLDQGQIDTLKGYADLLYTDLNYIETLGGGSARCMIAEVYPPKN